jgi:hypothetical protein
MTLQNSWKAHFLLLTMVNKSGNHNIPGFTGLMDFESSLKKKLTSLNQMNSFLLTANNKREIVLLHNPTNFNRTLLHSTNKVGCLVRVGPRATLIIVNERAAFLPPRQMFHPIPTLTSV